MREPLFALVLNGKEDLSDARERITTLRAAARLHPFTASSARSYVFRVFPGMNEADQDQVANWLTSL
jgi:hypothetical protein